MFKKFLIVLLFILILLYSVFITYIYFINHSPEKIWQDIVYGKDLLVSIFQIIKVYSESEIESLEKFLFELLQDGENFSKCLIYGCDNMKRTIFINSKFEDFLITYQENKPFLDIVFGIMYGLYRTYTTALKIVFLLYYLIFSDQFIADMIMYHVITHLVFTLPRELAYRFLAGTNFISLWRFQKLGNFLLSTGIYNTLSETMTWLIVIRIILLAIGLPYMFNLKSIYIVFILIVFVFYRTLKQIHNEVSYKIELKIHADIRLKKNEDNPTMLAIKNNYVREMMKWIEMWWEGVPLLTIFHKYAEPFRPFYGLHASDPIIFYITWPLLIIFIPILFAIDVIVYMVVWSIIFFWMFPYLDNKRIAPGLWDKMTNVSGLRSIFVVSEHLHENQGYFYLLIRTFLLTIGWEGTDPLTYNRISSFYLFFKDFYDGYPKRKDLRKILEEYAQKHSIDLRYVNANFLPENPSNRDKAFMMLEYWRFKGRKIAPLHPTPELLFFTGKMGINNRQALDLANRMINEEMAKFGVAYPLSDQNSFDDDYLSYIVDSSKDRRKKNVKPTIITVKPKTYPQNGEGDMEIERRSSKTDEEIEMEKVKVIPEKELSIDEENEKEMKEIESYSTLPPKLIDNTNSDFTIGHETCHVERKDCGIRNDELIIHGMNEEEFRIMYEKKYPDFPKFSQIYVDISSMFSMIRLRFSKDDFQNYVIEESDKNKFSVYTTVTYDEDDYVPFENTAIRREYVRVFPAHIAATLNRDELIQRGKNNKIPYNKDFQYDLYDVPMFRWDNTEQGKSFRRKVLNSLIRGFDTYEHLSEYSLFFDYCEEQIGHLDVDKFFERLIDAYFPIVSYLPRIVYTTNTFLYSYIPHFKKPLYCQGEYAHYIFPRVQVLDVILGNYLYKGSHNLMEYDTPALLYHIKDQAIDTHEPYILSKLMQIEDYQQTFKYYDNKMMPVNLDLPNGYIYGSACLTDVCYKKFITRLQRCKSFHYRMITYLGKFPTGDKAKVALYLILENSFFFQRFFLGSELSDLISLSGVPRSFKTDLMFVICEDRSLVNFNNLVREKLNTTNVRLPSEFLQILQDKEAKNLLTEEDLQKLLELEKSLSRTHDVIYNNKEILTYTQISPKVIRGLEVVGFQKDFNMKPRIVYKNESILQEILMIDPDAPYNIYAPSNATEDLAFQTMEKYVPRVSVSFNRVYMGVSFKEWAFSMINQFLNIDSTFIVNVRKLSDITINELSRDSRKAYAGKEMAAFGYRNKSDRFESQIKYAEAFRDKVLRTGEVSHSWAGLFVPKTEKKPKQSVRVVLAPESYFYFNQYLLFESFVEIMNNSKITNKFNPFFKNFDKTCFKLSRKGWIIQSLDLVSMGGRIPIEIKDLFVEWYGGFLQSRNDKVLLNLLMTNIFDCNMWMPTYLGGYVIHKKQGWGDGPYGTNQFDTWVMLVYYLYNLFRNAEDEGLSLTIYNDLVESVIIESHGDNWIHSARDPIIYTWKPKYLKELGQEIKDKMQTSYLITDHELMGYNIKLRDQIYVGFRPYAKTIKTLYYNKRSFKDVDNQRAYENGIIRSIFLTDCMNPLSSRLLGSLVGPRMSSPSKVHSEQEAQHLWILENLSYRPERAWLEENPTLNTEYEDKIEYAIDIPSPKTTEREAEAEESSRTNLKS